MCSSDETAEPGHVLVVDDLPENRLLVRLFLSDVHRVVEAATGAEALAAISRAAPGLVLLDLSLGTEDGRAVLARLRNALVPGIPILAFSASMDHQRAVQMGFDGHVGKPIVDVQAFAMAIDQAVYRPTAGATLAGEMACPG